MLANVRVVAVVAEAKAQLSEKLEMAAERVLAEVMGIAYAKLGDV